MYTGCTTNPTGAWVTQQARNISFTGLFERVRFLIHDRGGFEDLSIPGGSAHIIAVLVPPVDEIDGTLDLGAAIQQRNDEAANAGWELYSVRVSATQ